MKITREIKLQHTYLFFRSRFFFVKLQHIFIFRHAQALAALKAWCHWLSQLHSLALKDSTYEPQCKGKNEKNALNK